MRQDSSSLDSSRFETESHCSYRSIQTLRCFTEIDEKGIPQQKCQRVYKKFKECPGRPIELFEQVEDNIDPNSIPGSKTIDSQWDVFGEGGDSELESFFAKLDGIFAQWSHRGASDGKGKSFRERLGSYFSFEKEREPVKKSNEWKQFEKDFTEI
eukprot:g3590.t1